MIKTARLLSLLAVIIPILPCLAFGTDSCSVSEVVDGDTLRVRCGGSRSREESVRLIGIDAPEQEPNEKAMRDATRSGQDLSTILAAGRKAASHARSLVGKGASVKLEYDVERRDRYGRRLAYVYLNNQSMLNERMVSDGFAALLTFPPNIRYVDTLREAYRKARSDRKGLWGEGRLLDKKPAHRTR
jgi:micrococcal nuclease